MAIDGRIRIKELGRRAGLNRQTIHYYLREELLHPPIEKVKNSAWYDASHVSRLLLIRDLRENKFLPIKAIKAILEDDQELLSFSGAQQKTINTFQQSLRGRKSQREYNLSLIAVAKEIMFTKAEIDELKKLGWIDSKKVSGKEMISKGQAELLRSWAQVRDAGLTPKRGFVPQDFILFDEALGELANQAASLIKDRLGNLDADKLETIYDRLVPALQIALGQTHAVKLEQELAKD